MMIYKYLLIIILLFRAIFALTTGLEVLSEMPAGFKMPRESIEDSVSSEQAIKEYQTGDYQKALSIFEKQCGSSSPQQYEPCLYAGLIHYRNGHYDTAETYFQSSVQAKPSSPEAWNNLGAVYLRRQQFNQAEDLFLKAITCDGQYPEAHYNLALIYDAFGRQLKAAKAFGKAIEFSKDIQLFKDVAHYRNAILAEQSGDVDLAARLYKLCISENPGFLNSYWRLGKIYAKQGKYGSAFEVFEDALKVDPNAVLFRVGKGVLYQKTGMVRKAVRAYRKILKNHPGIFEIRILIADNLTRTGHYSSAEQLIKTGLDMDPENSELTKKLLELYFISDQTPEGLKVVEDLFVRSASVDPEMIALYGGFLAGSGREVEAKATADSLVKKEALTAGTHYWLGHLFVLLGDYTKAVGHFVRTCQIDEDYYEAYINASASYKKIGDFEAAIRELKTLFAVNPSDGRLAGRIGKSFAELGMMDSAFHYMRLSVAMEPENRNNQIDLGYLFISNREYDSGLVVFKRIAKDTAFCYEGLTGLGYVEMYRGNFRRSQKYFKKALKDKSHQSSSYLNLYNLYNQYEKWKKAVKIIKKAMKKNTGLKEPEAAIADLYYQQKKYKHASRYYQAALKKAPRDNRLQFAEAVCQFHLREYALCSAKVEIVARDSLYLMDAVNLRAQMNMKWGRSERAIDDYKQVLQWAPMDYVALNNLAWLYANNPSAERTGMAEEYILRCLASDSVNVDYLDTYAQILKAGGKINEAVKVLKKAEKLDRKKRYWKKRIKEVESRK